jgi:hypothetical protein
VHVGEQELPLFPLGCLSAAGALDDEAFKGFMAWICFARAQYLAFD